MTADNFLEKKMLFRDTGLFLIKAFDAKGNKTVFERSSICHLQAAGADNSLVVLKSGLQIPLPIPCDELEQRIYFMPSSYSKGALDFCGLAGLADLSPVFKAEAQKPAASDEADLVIAGHFREGGSDMYFPLEFPLSAINFKRCEETSSRVTGREATKIYFQPGFFPQDNEVLVLDIARQSFFRKVNAARQNKMQKLFINLEEPLLIKLNVRKTRQEVSLPFTFTDENINWKSGAEKIEKSLSVTGREGFKIFLQGIKSPFGEDEVIVDMPLSYFMSAYKKAKETNSGNLDLTKESDGKKRWFGR